MNTLIRIVYEVNGEIFKAGTLETEHFIIKAQNFFTCDEQFI